jgi:hypothetical protein
MSTIDPYFDYLVYRGSDGTVVELRFERTSAMIRVGWWLWKFGGESEWRGERRDKLHALLDAAHARGMSGAAFDAKPVTLRLV